MAALTVSRIRMRLVAMKAETSPGGDIFAGTYVAADVIPAYNIQTQTTIDELENTATAGLLGRQASIIGRRLGGVTFSMNFRGKAAGVYYDDSPLVVPEIHLPMLACGHGAAFASAGIAGSSITYTPGTEATYTIYVVHQNGRTLKLTGCLGTVTFRTTAAGVMVAEFAFVGSLAGWADVTYVPGAMATTPQYPITRSAAFQLGSGNYAPRLAAIGFALNNQLQLVPDANAATGVAGYFLADRNPRVTFDPEEATAAIFDWYGQLDAETLMDCSFQTGTVALNRLKFNFARLQLTAQNYQERDGLVALANTLVAVLASGDDDYSVVVD